MAKLEFYRQQVVPRIATPSARGLAAVGTQAAETTEAIARGAQAFAQMQQLSERVGQAERAQKLTQLNAAAMQSLNEFELGLETDTDYGTYESRYDKQLQKIQDDVAKVTDGDNALFEAWRSDFARTAIDKRFNVRRAAVKGRIGVARADLDQSLGIYAGLAGSDDPAKDADVSARANLAIQDALAAGIISPQEAVDKSQKFNSSAITNRVNRDMFNNPIATRQRLIDNAYPGLDEPTRTKLLNRATDEATQAITRQNAVEERADRQARRARDDMERNLGFQVDQMIATGDLDGLQGFLSNNGRLMNSSDRTRALKAVRRQDIVTDFTTYSTLSERAAGGENVEPEARQAVMQGLLSDNDYRVVVNASRETGWRKRGYSHIADNLKPSEFEKKVGNTATIRSANALRDWNTWVRENPSATDAQADTEAKRIVAEYSNTAQVQSVATLRRPTYLVSTGPSSFDLKQTFARTKQAFDKGQIPKAEYEKQAALIRQWMQVYKPPAPRPQPAK
jgi:hypothetical protein